MKLPGPDHPISISPARRHVTVIAGGQRVAESDRALVMREARYPPVYYLPRENAAMDRLEPSEHVTYCPFKGEARYFSIPTLGDAGRNIAWSYETPYSAVAEIAGCLAFYADRVDVEIG